MHVIKNPTTHDFLTALLKVEEEVNVWPSRYLFSPSIICLILWSSSSAFSVKGLSDAYNHIYLFQNYC